MAGLHRAAAAPPARAQRVVRLSGGVLTVLTVVTGLAPSTSGTTGASGG